MAVFGDEGFDVIVASGFNLGTATIEAANLYPDSKFIAVDMPAIAFTPAGETTPTNFTGLIFPEDQAGFLVGALASMMSKSHHIGGVFATDVVPAVWRFGEGYAAGAAYADTLMGTTTVVDKIYHNDVGFDKTFIDPEWAASAANSMIDQGADAIFGGGGSTGNGAVVAAAQRSVYAIGVDVDQYYTLPEAASYMLTSATKAIQPGVYGLIKAAVDGTFVGGGDNVAAIGYAPFHDLDSQVSADIKAKMEEIAKGLADGTIKTNVAPTKP